MGNALTIDDIKAYNEVMGGNVDITQDELKTFNEVMGTPEKNVFQEVIDVFSSQFTESMDNLKTGELNTKEMTFGLNVKEKAQLTELESRPHKEYDRNNPLLRTVGAVAGQLPIMGKTILAGLGGAGIGAGGALLLGQAGPQVGLPEEIITVPTAAIWAGRTASAYSMFETEAGLMRSELKQEKDLDGNYLPDALVKGASFTTGIINAGLEFVGFSAVAKTIPGMGKLTGTVLKNKIKEAIKDESLKPLLIKIGKDYAKGVVTESTTEALQEFVSLISADTAKKISGKDFAPVNNKIERIMDSAVDAALATMVIGGVGSTGRTIQVLQKQGKTEQETTSQVESMNDVDKKVFLENNSETLQEVINEDFNKYEAQSMAKTATLEGGVSIDVPAVSSEKADFYQKNLDIIKEEKSLFNKIKNIPENLSKSNELTDKIFVPISTRLSKIDESLKHAIRKFEFSVNTKEAEARRSVEPFVKAVSKMSEDDYYTLDLALKNRDKETIDSIINKNGLQKEFSEVKKTLNKIYDKARKVGIDVNFTKEYFPRKVKKANEFLSYLRQTENWSAIEEYLNEIDPENTFNNELKVSHINNFLRDYGQNKISLSAPGYAKERTIKKVTPELNTYYKDSIHALLDYISQMNNNIESRKFFGKDKTPETNIDESIGGYVKKLIDDQLITADKEKLLKNILMARFNQVGTSGVVSTFKNFSYIATMGSPISAITQIGDFAFSLYKNGLYSTSKSILKSLTNQKRVTKADLGIEQIAQEFSDNSTSSKAVSLVFKAVGLEFMDKLGKEATINAAFDRLQKAAKKGSKNFDEQLKVIFGEESESVKKDLIEGNATENVKYLLFSELADVQPIALSEMPEAYLSGGNSRVFYMLKTYTLKLFDVYHNEVFRNIGQKPLESVGNLVKLTASLALMGATTDVLKDILLGREIDFDDLVIDNILKLMGFNRWQLHKARREGLFTMAMQTILPPVPLLDDIYKDAVMKEPPKIKDWRVLQRFPLVGKFYYFWFGGGAKKKKTHDNM